MTSTTCGIEPRQTARSAATVACLTSSPALAGVLQGRLCAPGLPMADWRIVNAEDLAMGTIVDVVVCDTSTAIEAATECWPTAAVLGLVPDRDDSQIVVDSLNAGADVCVRGSDPTLVAAYLTSLARRRGLIDMDLPR